MSLSLHCPLFRLCFLRVCLVLLVTASLIGVAATTPALATYPDHLIRIVVPFPPGGAVDILGRLMKGKTSIVIAHRLHTIRAADIVLVIDNGGIVERGRHEQLVQGAGLYSELHRLQLGPDKIPA